MQQKSYRAVAGASLGVSDIQEAGVDLLQGRERGVRPRLDCGQVRFCRAGLSVHRTAHAELRGGNSHGRGADKAAARKSSASNLCKPARGDKFGQDPSAAQSDHYRTLARFDGRGPPPKYVILPIAKLALQLNDPSVLNNSKVAQNEFRSRSVA